MTNGLLPTGKGAAGKSDRHGRPASLLMRIGRHFSHIQEQKNAQVNGIPEKKVLLEHFCSLSVSKACQRPGVPKRSDEEQKWRGIKSSDKTWYSYFWSEKQKIACSL